MFAADVFTDEDKRKFENPEYYKQFRRELESELNVRHVPLRALTRPARAHQCPKQSVHPATLRDTPMQLGGRAVFKEQMRRRLAKKPWIADHRTCSLCACVRLAEFPRVVIPEFSVACRRLTPGPGYLEALCEDNVCVLFTQDDEHV